MTDLLRQEIAATADLVVVKVGTRVLTHPDGTLDNERISRLAEEIHLVSEMGKTVVLVSSGAVGAGMSQMGLRQRPNDLAKLQAIAAIGQTHLIETYDRTFRKYGHRAAQVLLIADDFDDRTRYLNVRNTLLSLIEFGAIPIINENDTVSVEELQTTFGDNDRLAAMVTNLLRAPLLIILSDVDGLYDGDPADESSKLISVVDKIDDDILSVVQKQAVGLSKGGMGSKLQAARIVTVAGENAIIASGSKPGILTAILRGEEVGTLLLAQGKAVSPRKRWIAFSARPQGAIRLDAGAHRAVSDQGRSLLAIGIAKVEGEFVKGDVLSLLDPDGNEFARGLTNYSSAEVRRVQGVRSEKIAEVLGQRPYEEVIHRNNLALLIDGNSS
ncbi:MAG: glutamate 5-kinase [Pirellulaceae bacterium]|jgi:glutamate 5-kinase